MRKYTFAEHFNSVEKVMSPPFINGWRTVDAREATDHRMIAYERWLNDRPLMLSEQNECGKECSMSPWHEGEVSYEGWYSPEPCELHKAITDKNVAEAKARNEENKRLKAEREAEEERVKALVQQECKKKWFC